MSALPDPPGDRILVRLQASAMRRGMAVAVLCALGALLVWLAATQPAALAWRLVLGAAGFLALRGAVEVWRATRAALILTRDGLSEEGGDIVATLGEIVSVDRGTFAFKPSNGFLLKLAARGPRCWAPGLWWRVGRRVGVGGVTASGEAKAMAECLTAMLAERDREE